VTFEPCFTGHTPFTRIASDLRLDLKIFPMLLLNLLGLNGTQCGQPVNVVVVWSFALPVTLPTVRSAVPSSVQVWPGQPHWAA
jgi:hypothetical protein